MHLPLSPAALAKAKAFGVVAAAITAGGAGGMVALNHVAPAPASAVTATAETTAPAAGPDGATTARPSATATSGSHRPEPTPTSAALPGCPADTTHGDYVRSVATASPTPSASGRGAAVSAAARSDCGHPAKPSHPSQPTSHPSRPAHTATARPSSTPHHTAGTDSTSSPADGHDGQTQGNVSDQPTADASTTHTEHSGSASGGHDH